jgi:DNA repair protein RadC
MACPPEDRIRRTSRKNSTARTIRNWPHAERPRERLLREGPGALADAEVLAILIGAGTRGRTAVDIGRELLGRLGSIRAIVGAGAEDLMQVRGLGPARQARIAAALELARRSLREAASEASCLQSPAAVRDYLRLSLAGREREVFMVLYLDNQHRLIASEELFQGSLTQASVHPREVVKAALRRNAAALIVAHNHPSGIGQASEADRQLTAMLRQTLAGVDVRLLDHFLIAGGQAISFAERGWC